MLCGATAACDDAAYADACGMWHRRMRVAVWGAVEGCAHGRGCGRSAASSALWLGRCGAVWRACPTVACVSQLGVFQGHNVHIYALSVDYVALRSSQIAGSDGEVERK
jgi:hypothetical protein